MSHDSGSGGHGDQGGHHSGQGHGFGDFSNADIIGSDVENINWSTLFSGLTINTGVRFVIVFTAFSCWLYVIYWIRHHEPLSNQVIGVSVPQSSTGAADRSIIARVSKVFPFQTPALVSGSFYTPTPGAAAPSPQPASSCGLGLYNKSFGEAVQEKVHFSPSAPGQAMSSPLIAPSEQEFDQRFGSPARP